MPFGHFSLVPTLEPSYLLYKECPHIFCFFDWFFSPPPYPLLEYFILKYATVYTKFVCHWVKAWPKEEIITRRLIWIVTLHLTITYLN
jgi:hypothetical protein